MYKYLNLVKFSHTIFAMPFAMVGFFLGSYTNASEQGFSWQKFLLIIICMVTARNAAMAFNRYIDADIDLKNPRTSEREIPKGIVSKKNALAFVILNCLIFVTSTYFINQLCFYLSPIALAVVLGYSLTKRFTWLCHFILGIGLSLAPVGAYIAVTGNFHITTVLLGLVVMLWVAGFDIVYALQDEEFDKANKLFSVPAFLGKSKGLMLARILHSIAAIILILTIFLLSSQNNQITWWSYMGAFVFICMLFYQHSLVKADDLSKINVAFFTTNGIASLVIGAFIILDLTAL